MLSVFMMSLTMLSVVRLSVALLIVAAPIKIIEEFSANYLKFLYLIMLG
jgi:hypothetical protein